MERLKRYEKQIVAVMSAFVILVGGVLSTSFNSKAAFIDYSTLHTEPTCSDTSGYVVLACNNSGTIVFRMYAWTIVPIGETDTFPTMDFQLGPSGSMTFTAQCVGNAHLTLWELYEDGGFNIIESTSFSASLPLTYAIYPPYAYSIKGNYGVVPTGYYNTVSVYWASEKQTINQLIQISSLLASMQSSQSSSNDKLTDLNLRLEQMFLLVDDVERLANSTYELLEEYMPYLREELQGVNEELDNLYAIMEDIKAEQKKTNTWLEKIWNSIQEFFNPSEEERTESEQFESETTEKSDEIGSLVEESRTDKPDVDDMSNSIDSNLDMTSANEYGAVLLNITENEYILQMLLIVVTVAIIAYVLFGKR